MRITFNLEKETTPQEVIDSDLERNDKNYVERMDGLGYIVAKHLTTGVIDDGSTASYGSKLVGKGKMFTRYKQLSMSTMSPYKEASHSASCI